MFLACWQSLGNLYEYVYSEWKYMYKGLSSFQQYSIHGAILKMLGIAETCKTWKLNTLCFTLSDNIWSQSEKKNVLKNSVYFLLQQNLKGILSSIDNVSYHYELR